MEFYTVFFGETKSGRAIWSDTYDNIELVVGMLAASVGIINDINSNEQNTIYFIDTDADVSDYRLLKEVREEYIPKASCGVLQDGEYGIWMKSIRRFHYDLYRFRTSYFFQGIISICTTFNVDFRNYIYGLPFDSMSNQFALANYVMTPYQVAVDVPDLDDIEAEEKDNENIIQPFERTDDIITIKD
jgi:hypothetical protein